MSGFNASVRESGEDFLSFASRVLAYNKETGVFTWRESRNGRALAGSRAGSLNQDGYLGIRIEGKIYLAHRLAFMFVTGVFPVSDVDHLNGIRDDNRWLNLRPATKAINAQNLRKANRRSTTGLLGVSPTGNGKFRAQIRSHGKVYCLGSYPTAEIAHGAYLDAKRVLHEGSTI